MKKLSYLAMILMLAGLIVHGCGGSEDAPASDQELLQGVWLGQIADMEGEFTMTISGNNFEFNAPDSEVFYKGSFVLNEKVTPKQGDFTIVDCFVEQYKGTIAKAIYKIENDTFTFAGIEPGVDARPADFVASDEVQVFTFKKQAAN